MKTLTFIRHAKSSWDNPGLRDFDRPLNNRGFRDAPEMGQRLLNRGFAPDMIISSTANRALTTAKLIAEAIDFQGTFESTDALYHSSLHDMLSIIHDQDNHLEHLVIVAHNPGIGSISSYLSNQPLDFPTCAVASIEYDLENWIDIDHPGTLLFYDFPKNA